MFTELECCRPYVDDDAEWDGTLEVGDGPLEGRNRSVPAVVLFDATALRFPVGAPKDPIFWVACKIPEAALGANALSCCDALLECM